jgi:hypothetical protein
MEKVMKDSEAFIGLEFIKERMLNFFDHKDAQAAAGVSNELGE